MLLGGADWQEIQDNKETVSTYEILGIELAGGCQILVHALFT